MPFARLNDGVQIRATRISGRAGLNGVVIGGEAVLRSASRFRWAPQDVARIANADCSGEQRSPGGRLVGSADYRRAGVHWSTDLVQSPEHRGPVAPARTTRRPGDNRLEIFEFCGRRLAASRFPQRATAGRAVRGRPTENHGTRAGSGRPTTGIASGGAAIEENRDRSHPRAGRPANARTVDGRAKRDRHERAADGGGPNEARPPTERAGNGVTREQ